MADPTFPLIPVIASIALLITVAPFGYISFREHTGVVMFMLWQSTNCIGILVNRILWHGSSKDLAPLWCDILTKVELGRALAIPATVLSMIRGIYRVVQMDSHFDTDAKVRSAPHGICNQKRRLVWECLAMTILFPAMGVGLYPFVATRRYVILEDCGCTWGTGANLLSLLLTTIWPMALSIIAQVYCVLTLRKCRKMRRGRQFSGQSDVNRFVFQRTVICAWMILAGIIPVNAYNLSCTLRFGVEPYPGLDEIKKLRKIAWVSKARPSSPHWEWLYIRPIKHLLPSFTFFLIFGTGEVAIRYYTRAISRMVTTLGLNGLTLTAVPSRTVEEIGMEFTVRRTRDSKTTPSTAEGDPMEEFAEPIEPREPSGSRHVSTILSPDSRSG